MQKVNEKLKEMCDLCQSHCDKPCAWVSLGNEYCTNIMNIQNELDMLQQETSNLKIIGIN